MEDTDPDLRPVYGTMTKRNPAQEALQRYGRETGLERRSGAWYQAGDEVIAVADLQKSQYGPQYYFNLGFLLRTLTPDEYPKPSMAHVSARLEALVPEERDRIAQLLDLEHDLPDEQRIDELVALFKDRVSPLIARGSSMDGLRAMVENGTLATAAVRGPALRALGVAD